MGNGRKIKRAMAKRKVKDIESNIINMDDEQLEELIMKLGELKKDENKK